MRIIKSGTTKKKSREVKAGCNACECKFAFTTAEARLVHDSRDGNYYEIKCPECKTPVQIDASLF